MTTVATIDLATGQVVLREMTPAEEAALAAEQAAGPANLLAQLIAQRDALAAQLDNAENVLRAMVLILMDELNLHSARLESILAATAAASTLANFKTGMAAIAPIPQRTGVQLKTAIRNKLGT